MRPGTIAAVVFLLVTSVPATAQTTGEPSRYVSAGLLFSTQPLGKSDCPYLCGPLGGTAFPGIAVGAAGRLDDRWVLGVEVSRGAALTGRQAVRDSQWTAVHRDSTVSAVAGFAPTGRADRVAAVIVVGGGVAFRSTSRRASHLGDIVPAVLAGVDVPVRVAPRLALVPFIRGHVLMDDDRNVDFTASYLPHPAQRSMHPRPGGMNPRFSTMRPRQSKCTRGAS